MRAHVISYSFTDNDDDPLGIVCIREFYQRQCALRIYRAVYLILFYLFGSHSLHFIFPFPTKYIYIHHLSLAHAHAHPKFYHNHTQYIYVSKFLSSARFELQADFVVCVLYLPGHCAWAQRKGVVPYLVYVCCLCANVKCALSANIAVRMTNNHFWWQRMTFEGNCRTNWWFCILFWW